MHIGPYKRDCYIHKEVLEFFLEEMSSHYTILSVQMYFEDDFYLIKDLAPNYVKTYDRSIWILTTYFLKALFKCYFITQSYSDHTI